MVDAATTRLVVAGAIGVGSLEIAVTPSTMFSGPETSYRADARQIFEALRAALPSATWIELLCLARKA